jgi:Periplasmic binding protein
VIDAHPDPAAAMTQARPRQTDILFGPYGSSPAIAALTAVAGPDGPVTWNHGGASSRLRWPAFPRVLNVLAPADTYFDGVLRAVRAADPSTSAVVVIHATTGFARDVASGAAVSASELGYDLRAVAFEPGAGGAAAAGADAPVADVVLVVGSFEDEVAVARVLLARRRRPWRAAAFVGAGVEDVLAVLGDGREGLLGPSQWDGDAALRRPGLDEGPDARWFRDAYRRATGEEPEYPAAQTFAAGVLACRCRRDAGSAEADAVVAAATQLRCRTLYGDFRLDARTGRQLGHQVLTVQWQQGVRRVVWPPEDAERPLVLEGRGAA